MATHDGGAALDDVHADIDAMGEALVAISRIPTYWRRVIAWAWLVERVNCDLRELNQAEHAARTAPSPKETQDAHISEFGK